MMKENGVGDPSSTAASSEGVKTRKSKNVVETKAVVEI
jgi:hypothetical protein